MSRYHSITKALLYKHFGSLLALDADVEAALGVGYAYALQVVILDRCIGVISNDVVDTGIDAFVVYGYLANICSVGRGKCHDLYFSIGSFLCGRCPYFIIVNAADKTVD